MPEKSSSLTARKERTACYKSVASQSVRKPIKRLASAVCDRAKRYRVPANTTSDVTRHPTTATRSLLVVATRAPYVSRDALETARSRSKAAATENVSSPSMPMSNGFISVLTRIIPRNLFAQAACRKTLHKVNHRFLGKTGARKISLKNYMSSKQITQEAAATTQTRKR